MISGTDKLKIQESFEKTVKKYSKGKVKLSLISCLKINVQE